MREFCVISINRKACGQSRQLCRSLILCSNSALLAARLGSRILREGLVLVRSDGKLVTSGTVPWPCANINHRSKAGQACCQINNSDRTHVMNQSRSSMEASIVPKCHLYEDQARKCLSGAGRAQTRLWKSLKCMYVPVITRLDPPAQQNLDIVTKR